MRLLPFALVFVLVGCGDDGTDPPPDSGASVDVDAFAGCAGLVCDRGGLDCASLEGCGVADNGGCWGCRDGIAYCDDDTAELLCVAGDPEPVCETDVSGRDEHVCAAGCAMEVDYCLIEEWAGCGDYMALCQP